MCARRTACALISPSPRASAAVLVTALAVPRVRVGVVARVTEAQTRSPQLGVCVQVAGSATNSHVLRETGNAGWVAGSPDDSR